MHKNIGSVRATSKKAKTAQSIESLHHRSFPIALWNDNDMGNAAATVMDGSPSNSSLIAQ